ncbi:hypothetical protein [Flavobacterium sp.]
MKKQDDKAKGTDAAMMKKFTESVSTTEIKKLADKILESDSDIDTDNLDKAANKFGKEKNEDAKEQAKNDADFKQPEM